MSCVLIARIPNPVTQALNIFTQHMQVTIRECPKIKKEKNHCPARRKFGNMITDFQEEKR